MILIATLWWVYDSRKDRADKKPVKVEKEQSIRLIFNPQETAKKIFAWLEVQKDSDGIYYFATECSPSDFGNCQPSADNRSGIRVIWAKFRAFQKNLGIIKKEDLLEDIATYSSGDKIPVLQNDFWNCKLMFELWESDLFGQETKNKIENICWRSGYYQPIDLTEKIRFENFQEKIDDDIKDVDFDLVNKGEYVFETKFDEEDKTKTREYSVYPSEFVARYLWRDDPAQLTKAKFYFDKAVQLYFSSPSTFGNDCLLGISSLDLYKTNKNSGYLDFVKTLFADNQDKNLDLTESAYCLFLSDELFEITKEDKFKDWERQKFNYLFQSGFEKDSEGKQGAFRLLEHIGKIFPIDENSLFAGLLIKI